MSHMVHEERFLAADGIPVWWNPSENVRLHGQEVSALDAYSRIGKGIVIELAPFRPVLESGYEVEELSNEQLMIVRHPIDPYGDPETGNAKYKNFGIVSGDYTILSHKQMAQIWDEHVGRPIQTAGILYEGADFFVSCKLPSIGIRGEEVNNNLVAVNRARFGFANVAMLTSVCPVCDNTVKWGESVASEKLRMIHDQHLAQRMAEWLGGCVERAELSLGRVKEYGELMAHTTATTPMAAEIIQTAIPLPNEPQRDCPPEVFETRFEKYELDKARIEKMQLETAELFLGNGLGMDLPSRQGTVWGVVQAVAEEMTYARGRLVGQSLLLGTRGAAVAKAVETGVRLCAN